jgi:hypothetical protein
MNILLFNFLEDYNTHIVNLVTGKINRTLPGDKEMSEDVVETLVEQVLDGYIDLLVTGQTDALDRTYGAISRVVAARGSKISDVFELPLIMTTVIRRLLADEYSDLQGEDGIRKFSQALEQTEMAGHRAACRFLDVFQERLEKSIDDHNDYLSKIHEEFGVDLSSFRIESVEGTAVQHPDTDSLKV